ncbi:hypothetical protein [Bacillus seohaeanensis]|jgi:hypothetical protein|uniref:YfhE family protein n=1 Tax=Bacillus seohaeanensis TaxID=284580 RepID=A0ABW5RNX4_9BACI
MGKKKQNFREEFGQEFGDINFAKHYELTQKQSKKKEEKKKC